MGDDNGNQPNGRASRKRRSARHPVKDYDEITTTARHIEQNLDLDLQPGPSSSDAVADAALSQETNSLEKGNRSWSPETKMMYEIMAALVLSFSDSPTLSTDEICHKITEMFESATPPSNIRFASRLRTVIFGSEFFEATSLGETAGSCCWKLVSTKYKKLKEFLDKFVEENEELAKEHGIQKSSHYHPDRKRAADASQDKNPIGNKKEKLEEAVVPPAQAAVPQVPTAAVNLPATAFVHSATDRDVPLKPVLPYWNPEEPRAFNKLKVDIDDSNGNKIKEVLKMVTKVMKDREEAQIALMIKKVEERLEAEVNALQDAVAKLSEELQAKTKDLGNSAVTTENVEVQRVQDEDREGEDDELVEEEVHKEGEEDDEVQVIKEEDSVDDDEEDANLEVKVIPHREIGEIYRTVSHLRSGSFGSVYRVKDSQKRQFAVKVTKMELLCDYAIATENDLEEMLNLSRRNGEQLPRYLSISQFFNTEIDGVLRRCEKMDLYSVDLFEALVDHRMTFSAIQTLQALFQLCSALEYLHERNFIHCDVKPDNIMFAQFDLTEGGKLRRIETRLIDFGVMVKAEEQPLLFTAQSAPYRAPEMALEMPCDNKIDIWALALVALQMIAGCDGFYLLNDNEVRGMNNFEKNVAILGEIQHLVGPIPPEMMNHSSNAAIRMYFEFPRILPGAKVSVNHVICFMVENTFLFRPFVDILRRMLQIDPNLRPTAAELVQRLCPLDFPE